jgi:hypothetical protein
MPVLGFYGNEPYNSGSGTGSPTIIRLGLWEDQVSGTEDVTITQPNRGKLPSLSITENPEVKF